MALPKVFLVGMGTAGRAEEFSKKIQTAQQDPAFRKASRNMIAANLAIETAVSSAHLNTADLKESAFILGSSYGELESTTEFLKNWVGSKLARPMIFQSSLHNGTLGFLALHLGLKGPSFTVSQQFFTGERSLELAFDLIRGEVVESALVAAVDIMNPELMPALIPHLPENFRWEDGASAVLLASEKFILEKKINPLAELLGFEFKDEEGHETLKTAEKFYDSDGIEKWIVNIIENKECSTLNVKPDHSEALIFWKPFAGTSR